MYVERVGKDLERERNIVIKRVTKFLRKNSRFPSREELRGLGFPETYVNTYFSTKENLFEIIGKNEYGKGGVKKVEEEEIKKKRMEIAKKYAKECKREKRMVEVEDAGISLHYLRTLFGSLHDLKEFVRKEFPDYIKHTIDYTVYDDERVNSLKRLVGNSKRFIITTAVEGAPVFKPFMESIERYCKITNSIPLIIPSVNDMGGLDKSLVDKHIVYDDMQLNNQLFISSIRVSPKMINPNTGLNRFSKGNKSFILSSPKQTLEVIAQPRGENIYPRVIVTTGAVTLPNYHGRKFIKHRTDTIAEAMHTCGALIVEIEGSNAFHYRPIQALTDGSFIDLGRKFSGSGCSVVPESVFIMGDLHWGRHDERVIRCWERLVKKVRAKKIYLHDLYDFISINHHERDKNITRARRYLEGNFSLEKELNDVTLALDRFTSQVKEVVVVKSNHDLFLDRYLEEGWYVKDPCNASVSFDLAKYLATGRDPLREYYKDKLRNPDKVTFLKESDFRKEYDVTVSCHGHRGINGSRGTLQSLANALGRIVVGNLHSPKMCYNGYQVGFSGGNHDYTKGPSSWLECSAVVYPGGSVQLINSIGGRFCLDDRA